MVHGDLSINNIVIYRSPLTHPPLKASNLKTDTTKSSKPNTSTQVTRSIAQQGQALDSFDGGQAGNFQLFLPAHSRGQPTSSQFATSESNGTNSSQYSIPQSDMPFENYRVFTFNSFNCCIYSSQIMKATSTSTSSFETGWPNFNQTDGGKFVSIEQYRSLQARYGEMHREHINLMKERALLETKNLVLKYVFMSYKSRRLTYSHFREAYDHLLERVPVSIAERLVLKREDYPNITFWFRHEYFAALAEDKITSVDDVVVTYHMMSHDLSVCRLLS
jgi:hypothetical protein